MTGKQRPSREPDLRFRWHFTGVIVCFWWKERIQTSKYPEFSEELYHVNPDIWTWSSQRIPGVEQPKYETLEWFLVNKRLIEESYFNFLIEESIS